MAEEELVPMAYDDKDRDGRILENVNMQRKARNPSFKVDFIYKSVVIEIITKFTTTQRNKYL